MGKYVEGKCHKIEELTKGWVKVDLPSAAFYRSTIVQKYNEALEGVSGRYTDDDSWEESAVFFEDPGDALEFTMRYDNG